MKPSVQDGTAHSQAAGRAVDGLRNTAACTNYRSQPWWSVDLVSPMDVGRVCVVNHHDGNPSGDTTVGQFHNYSFKTCVKMLLTSTAISPGFLSSSFHMGKARK